MLGLLLGSQLGSKIIQWNGDNNLNRVVVGLCAAMAFSSALKCIMNFWTLLVARFLFGLFSGASNPIIAKVMTDTIPVKSVQLYGLFQGGGIGVAIFFTSLIESVWLPEATGPKEALMKNTDWRGVYIINII